MPEPTFRAADGTRYVLVAARSGHVTYEVLSPGRERAYRTVTDACWHEIERSTVPMTTTAAAPAPDIDWCALLMGAALAAEEEEGYQEMRLLDRTGERYRRTEARVARLREVRAWIARRRERACRPAPPPAAAPLPFTVYTDVDAIPF